MGFTPTPHKELRPLTLIPQNLTMGKFLGCRKMTTLLTVELCFGGNFLSFQNLTMVKFLDFSGGSLLGVNERGKTQSNAVLRSGFFAFTNPLEPERSKTKQDASSSRRVRIRRRERTYSYVTKTKRKLDEEMRSGFFVLHRFTVLYPRTHTPSINSGVRANLL